MLKRFWLAAVMLIVLIAFAGCIKNETTMVGVWHSEQDKLSMTINKDGTFSLKDETIQGGDLLSGTYRIEGDKFLYTPTHEAELVNTYTLKGDTLILKYQEYSSTFKRVEK